jgi:DNA polymerase-1
MQKTKYVVIDIEGNLKDVRVDPDSLTLGFSYAYRSNQQIVAGYIPINHAYGNVHPDTVKVAKYTLEKFPIETIYHNAKYDLVGLRNNLGIDLLNTNFWCTLMMAHFIKEWLPSKQLDYVSKHWGGNPKNKTDAQQKLAENFGYENIPVELMYDYSTNDAIITLELFEKLLKEFKRQFSFSLWELEREWHRFIIKMEACGIALDEELIRSEIEQGEQRLREISQELGGNPGSPKFLQDLFFNKLGLPVVKYTSGGKSGKKKPCFDKTAMAKYEELLERKNDITAQRVLEYRGYQKTVSSNYRAYIELRSHDGLLRPNYKLHGTVGPRMSCEKPNLQQIPRVSDKSWNGSLKKAFVAHSGYTLWNFDYSNLELRVAAVYAQEENLLQAFRNGFKPFDEMAERLGWPRQDCKTFTYTVSFGGGYNRIHEVFGVSMARAEEMRDIEFFGAYPALRTFSKKCQDRAAIRGYIKLWTGRIRHFQFPKSESHKAMNSVVQGGAAELVKHAGIKIGHLIDWDECKILLQTHDSYTAEIKNGTEDKWIPLIKETMEDIKSIYEPLAKCPYPVEVKIWGEE